LRKPFPHFKKSQPIVKSALYISIVNMYIHAYMCIFSFHLLKYIHSFYSIFIELYNHHYEFQNIFLPKKPLSIHPSIHPSIYPSLEIKFGVFNFIYLLIFCNIEV
jgi:hypothetical protein